MQINAPAITSLQINTGVNERRVLNTPSAESPRRGREDDANAQNFTQTSFKENPADELATQRELQKLKNIDRDVRAHEQAHLSAAGQYATSGASFSYQQGPDGRLYAVSGEVKIDTAAIPGDPLGTLQKAQTIVRAALAPVNPSSQDRRVAAQGAALAQQARIEIAIQQESREYEQAGQYLDAFA